MQVGVPTPPRQVGEPTLPMQVGGWWECHPAAGVGWGCLVCCGWCVWWECHLDGGVGWGCHLAGVCVCVVGVGGATLHYLAPALQPLPMQRLQYRAYSPC